MPTPRRLPILTMGLLFGGMAIFILENLFPVPANKVFVAVGTIVFLAGMIFALVGAIWSICTLTNPALRRTYGVTTPITTILLAAFALSGALFSAYKFKTLHAVQKEMDANIAAETVPEVKVPPTVRTPSVEQSAQESATPQKSNDEGK